MRNYDGFMLFLTVKYAKEYWVSEEYKITNKFDTSHYMWMMRSISSHSDWKCAESPPFSFLTAFSRFSIVQWIFELSQWWPPSICFRLPLWSLVDLQTEVVGLRMPNPAAYPKCSNLRSGEFDAHSSAAMKSGVFCRRNCCVTFARCDGTLSCRNPKSLPRYA